MRNTPSRVQLPASEPIVSPVGSWERGRLQGEGVGLGIKKRMDFSVIALIEEPDMRLISRRKFQRAQNRDISMPIFRGDEEAALDAIERKLAIRHGAA